MIKLLKKINEMAFKDTLIFKSQAATFCESLSIERFVDKDINFSYEDVKRKIRLVVRNQNVNIFLEEQFFDILELYFKKEDDNISSIILYDAKIDTIDRCEDEMFGYKYGIVLNTNKIEFTNL